MPVTGQGLANTTVPESIQFKSDQQQFEYLPATLYTQTVASAAIASSAAETSLLTPGSTNVSQYSTNIIPPNFFRQGKSLRFTISGTSAIGTSSSLTIKLKLDSTALVTLVIAATTWTTSGFVIDGTIACLTTGATGSLGAWVNVDYGNTFLAQLQTFNSTASVDTTAQHTLDCTVQFGVSNAGNTIQAQYARIDITG